MYTDLFRNSVVEFSEQEQSTLLTLLGMLDVPADAVFSGVSYAPCPTVLGKWGHNTITVELSRATPGHFWVVASNDDKPLEQVNCVIIHGRMTENDVVLDPKLESLVGIETGEKDKKSLYIVYPSENDKNPLVPKHGVQEIIETPQELQGMTWIDGAERMFDLARHMMGGHL